MLDASCWMLDSGKASRGVLAPEGLAKRQASRKCAEGGTPRLAKVRSLEFLNACTLALVVLYPNLAGEVNRETAVGLKATGSAGGYGDWSVCQQFVHRRSR